MFKHFIGTLAISFLIIGSAAGQQTTKNSSPKSSGQPSIATIGGQPVYTSDFAYVYNKNNASSPDAYTVKNIQEYLELYLNFRLKVKEAEEMGLDTSAAFNKELDGYKKQLAQPYLSEKRVTDSLILVEYERMKEEIKASHILIKCPADASPKDTLIAFEKITAIKKRISAGEDFEIVGKETTEDAAVSLGYFTALQMVYTFEDVAYNTKPGQVSAPFRTQFGYHLVKVYDRRANRGEFRSAHIMIRATAGISPQDSLIAKQKIDEIYNRLQQGESWETLVTQFSDDPSSKGKGGELPWLTAGRVAPAFADAAFSLEPGQFSKPVQTAYGWHIVKLLEKKSLPALKDIESDIRTKVSKESRSELNKQLLIQRIKRENGYTEYSKNIAAMMKLADTTLVKGVWNKKTTPVDKKVLFSLQKKKYTGADFNAYMSMMQRPFPSQTPQQVMNFHYTNFLNKSLIEYEESQLEGKYIDYRMLVKEYRDGILLFQLMDDKVWSKAIEDTAGLKKYYNEHKENYRWGDRVHAYIFNAANAQLIDKIKADLKQDKFLLSNPPPQTEKFLFSSNTAALSAEDKSKLDRLSLVMNRNKDMILEVFGTRDLQETTTVSQQRVDSVKAYLVMKGIKAERILTTDWGKTKAKGKTAADMANDRYITFSFYSTNRKTLEAKYNENAPLNVQYSEGSYQKGENEFVDKVEWKAGTYMLEKDGRSIYVVITSVEAPRLKTFEESRGLVISDYQGYLEKEWIKQLRQKYPVTKNEAEIQRLAQEKK